MRFSVYQVSRKGGREKNEDRMGYCYTRDSGLFALADGMGGHPEGEVASQLALQTLAGAVPARGQADAEGPAALPAMTPCWPATTSCCATPPSAP
jgi:serine/threonine protein phosphatase PrpC